MIDEITTGIIGVLTTVIGSWTGWVLARRKYNSEVDGKLIENMQKSLDFYKNLSDDNEQRLDKVLEDNVSLRLMVEELLLENKQLKKELDILKDQVIKITTTICTDLSCQIRSRDFTTLTNENNEETEFD